MIIFAYLQSSGASNKNRECIAIDFPELIIKPSTENEYSVML